MHHILCTLKQNKNSYKILQKRQASIEDTSETNKATGRAYKSLFTLVLEK